MSRKQVSDKNGNVCEVWYFHDAPEKAQKALQTFKAVTIKDLSNRLLTQADAVEADGHITAARLMREAAFELNNEICNY